MAIVTTRPRTRQYDERLIKRKQEYFEQGMLRQLDTEGIDVGNHALADCINGRCGRKHVDGRGGSQLWTPADFGVTIGGTETIATAMQTGELYSANDDTVPSIGDVFMTYGESDFTGGELATAKGDTARKWDCWYVVNNASGSEEVRYLGNLRLPAVPGYGDTTATEFTASKAGTTITVTSGPTLPTDGTLYGGYFFAWYGGTRDLITAVPSTTTLTTQSSGTVASASKGVLHAPVNSTLVHKASSLVVGHFGNRIYVSTKIPLSGWTEVPGAFDQRPVSGPSVLFPWDDDAVLFTANGIWYIYLTSSTGPYFWKMNTSLPHTRILDVALSAGLKYKYRYTYTMVTMASRNMHLDRFNGSDGAFLKKESAPVAVDANNVDYGERWTDEPVGDGTTTYGKLTGAALSSPYDEISGWNSIEDAGFVIPVNGTSYSCQADLRSTRNLADIAIILEDAVRVHQDLKECTVEVDNGVFVFKTGEGDSVSYATAGSGTDIATALGWTSAAGATVSTPLFTTPYLVGRMFVPSDCKDATHYGVYRTRDCSELSDNEHAYTWVGDIPVARCVTGSINANGVMTTNVGDWSEQDEGCILVGQDGTRVMLDDSSEPNPTVLNPDGSTYSLGAISVQSWGIGGGTVFRASQSDTTITIVSGKTLAATDVGKPIFWADRGYSIIKSVTDASTATAAWAETHAAQAAVMDPIAREFKDTISDEDITKGRNSSYPLRNRFWKPMVNGGVGVVGNGYMVVADRAANELRYSQAADKYLAGYHHVGFQVDRTVWDGVQSLRVVDGGILIRGAHDTYFLDTDAGYDVGNPDVGESCIALESPNVISRGIGSIGDGGVQDLADGGEVLITSEPALKTAVVTDGAIAYSKDNYAIGAVQKHNLNKLKPNYVTAYQRRCGLFIYGEEET